MRKNIIISIIVILIVAALVALICYTPTLAKNRFMSSIESNNFQDANGIFEQNQENSPIKNESSQIIEILDGKIEKVLVDLYEEKADFNEAEALAKLYVDFASSNGHPLENGENLKSTIDMYHEIDAMKACIQDGQDFDALGKGLIYTVYADVEVYTQVLSRYIDESNIKDVVAGVDNAVDYHISRAEGNYNFMKVPALLAEENHLSNFLFDDADRNRLTDKINEYNKTRTCVAVNCQEWTKDRYCKNHKCEDDDCVNMKTAGKDYCYQHTCIASGCSGYRGDNGDNYCYEHECSESGCQKYAVNGDYCSSHAKKKSDNTSSSSSSGYFTNKYGTRTTRCVVSGCSNYIASSGDTNCCTSHSNRCGECRCYIDGDAMFCMSCLTSALQ